jgi:hypothetical protein
MGDRRVRGTNIFTLKPDDHVERFDDAIEV